MMALFSAGLDGNAAPLLGSRQAYPALLMAPVVREQTFCAPGTISMSSDRASPTHSRWNFPPPPPSEHLPDLQESLSPSSLLSQSSPPDFLAALHFSPEQEPLAHSSAFSQSSPPPFFSAHFPPTHALLVHCESLSQSSPEAFLLLHPGKSGGHSAPASSPHCLGALCPGSDGAGPEICALTGTVYGLLRLPEVATGSLPAL